MDSLNELEARSLKRRMALAVTVMFAPILGFAALLVWFPFGLHARIGSWGMTGIHMAVLIGCVFIGRVIAKCPRCPARLPGLRVPAVCENCQTILLPGSHESLEAISRSNRPRIPVSAIELEEQHRTRRRAEWAMLGVAVGIGGVIVATEVFGWSGFASVLALPIAGSAMHALLKSLKCPNCGEIEELNSKGDCKNCGAMLAGPK